MNNYQETSWQGPDLKRRLQEKVQTHRSERGDLDGEGSTVVKRLKVQCYYYQELSTSLNKDCPKPKVNRCRWCERTGHIVSTCQGGVESTKRRTQVMHSNTTIRLINQNSDDYRKIAFRANGE